MYIGAGQWPAVMITYLNQLVAHLYKRYRPVPDERLLTDRPSFFLVSFDLSGAPNSNLISGGACRFNWVQHNQQPSPAEPRSTLVTLVGYATIVYTYSSSSARPALLTPNRI